MRYIIYNILQAGLVARYVQKAFEVNLNASFTESICYNHDDDQFHSSYLEGGNDHSGQ